MYLNPPFSLLFKYCTLTNRKITYKCTLTNIYFVFYSILRANDTEKETQTKQNADTEAHRRARQNNTREEKLARQEADTEAHRRARQNKTKEEKLAKQKADTEAHSRARKNETEELHQSRNAKDATAKRIKANKK